MKPDISVFSGEFTHIRLWVWFNGKGNQGFHTYTSSEGINFWIPFQDKKEAVEFLNAMMQEIKKALDKLVEIKTLPGEEVKDEAKAALAR